MPGLLKETDGSLSSSRHVLVYGLGFVGAFFLFINIGIGLGWWEYAKWSGSLEWVKWATISVVVPYSFNQLGGIGK